MNYIKFDTIGRKYKREQKDKKKLVFQKESVENADLYKSVLNKIMTAHK